MIGRGTRRRGTAGGVVIGSNPSRTPISVRMADANLAPSPFWTRSEPALLATLHCGRDGLTTAEAAARLQ